MHRPRNNRATATCPHRRAIREALESSSLLDGRSVEEALIVAINYTPVHTILSLSFSFSIVLFLSLTRAI